MVLINWIRFGIQGASQIIWHLGQSILDSFNGLELRGRCLWRTWKSYPVLSLNLDHKNEGVYSSKDCHDKEDGPFVFYLVSFASTTGSPFSGNILVEDKMKSLVIKHEVSTR
jgi:hypothetical protein